MPSGEPAPMSPRKGEVRIGTSGWVYPHWRGLYYPEDLPQKDWFGQYVGDFDTVEINNSFYRLPKPETFEHWGEVAPKGFLYTFKASRYITHVKRLKDPEATLQKFLDRVRLAGRTLGPLLFQLPPRWNADPERLRDFLNALPEDLDPVLEFRDDSWYSKEVRRMLEEFRVAFCIHDHGSAPSPEWVTSTMIYLRFHGSAEENYAGSYSDETLRKTSEQISAWSAEGKRVFVYFNNDIGGHAIRNALTLKNLLA